MIFISYSSKDDATVKEFLQLFRENNIDYWYAPVEIQAGEFYCDEITQALKQCERVVAFVSQASMDSNHVKRELELSLKYKKMILPVFLENVALEDSYEYILSGCQSTFYYDEAKRAAAVESLLQVLKAGAEIFDMTIAREPQRIFTMIKGGYQENMQKMLDKYTAWVPGTLFAMGIDRTAILAISSTGGVIKAVVEWLKESYQVTMEELQELIDKAIEEQLPRREGTVPMEYGDCIVIEVKDHSGNPNNQPLHLLLVANSQKGATFTNSQNVDDLIGVDSREIILKVFNKCAREYNIHKDEEHPPVNLFIPAMGTNGLAFPYEIVTSEILNAYLYAYKKNFAPFNLFFSIQQRDLDNNGVTTDQIYRYVNATLGLTKKRKLN